MTIPRLLALETYWGSHPPIHDMLAAFFGIKGKTAAAEEIVNADDAGAAFIRDFMAAGGIVTADLEAKE